MIDMLQIHHYTPEDRARDHRRRGRLAQDRLARRGFDELFAKIRADIASVPGAEHVRVCLDEWGWGRAGHTGAVFMAGCLNSMHRAAPLVQLGARAARDQRRRRASTATARPSSARRPTTSSASSAWPTCPSQLVTGKCWMSGHLRGLGERAEVLVDFTVRFKGTTVSQIEAVIDPETVARLQHARLRP